MFLTYPTNLDEFIDDVRLHIGDYENTRYSDSIVRSSLVTGVKMLQRRWKNRYLVFVPSMVVNPLPSNVIYQTEYDALVAASGSTLGYDTIVPIGYLYGQIIQGYANIPSGLKENDVFRNPFHTFTDPGSATISQEDEYPIVLAAAIILRKTQLSSSAASFQSWSDGEIQFSNIASANAMRGLYDNDLAALDKYFQNRLGAPLRSSFPRYNI